MDDRNPHNVTVSSSEVSQVQSRFLRSRKKRFVDVVFSLVGLVFTLVMLPFIALAITLDSRGAVFYKQTRLGLDGSTFELIKFRTMVNNAEKKNGPVWAVDNDPRITRVGRILRTLYIDEFPQWWNVLMGDMSVVGPRPERPEFTKLIAERYPKFPTRLEAKPGITGLAQTEYHYTKSVADSRHKLNYDQRYISRASIRLDIWIVLRTFRRMLSRAGS
jgi:lipopolysaccharide/colanic/teichoic acid biosynthesis glycosyltransferase